MSIWSQVNVALIGLGLPMAANVYRAANGAELPDLYLVYFLVSSPPEQHADDVEKLRSYRMQVSIYSRNGLEGLPDVDTAMVGAGFTRGPITEIPFNQVTGHYGLALEYIFLEEQ